MAALSRYEFGSGDFARICGVTGQTLKDWEKEGLPPPSKPVKNSAWWDLRVHLPWVVENKWKPNQTAKARKLEAETQLQEMKRDEQAGILVRADLVQREWEDVLARFRTNIRGLPARLVPLLEEASSTRERMDITSREIDQILLSLVDGETE